jgi:hypothetical protein
VRTLTGIRPSLWARCTRAAALQGQGHAEAPMPPEADEYLFRGNVFEEITARRLQAKHGKQNVLRQIEVTIPGVGVGHPDFYMVKEKAIGEAKSTVSPFPNSPIFEAGAKQAKIYTHFHPEAERGYLYMLDPNRMKPADVYEIKVSDDDAEEIEAERLSIVEAVAGADLPPRICTHPGQARSHMCPLAAACFPDWEPEPADEITNPDALDAVSRLAAIKREKRQHASAIKALEEGEKLAQAELAEVVEHGDSIVGPFKVRRTLVERKPAFSVRAFEAAGHSVEPLAEFFVGGSSHDRWTITVADEAGDIDYGGVPF